MDKRVCTCCDRKTCSKFQVQVQNVEPSSQKSSTVDYSDKQTQKTPTPPSAVTSDQTSRPAGMDKRLCSCCARKTCSKNQMPVQDEDPSSQKSSTLEYSDKETQKTTTPSSTKSAATSETHFNRNNENLSTPPPPAPLKFPINAAHTYNQTDCANYPSIMSKISCQQGRHTTQCQCMEAYNAREETTDTYLHELCELRREFETSSSYSTVSDHYPIRLELKMKAHDTGAEHPITPRTRPCPEHLQPCDTMESLFFTPKTPTSSEDEYCSCSSASSDTETQTDSCTVARRRMDGEGIKLKDRDCAILQLLHEVVHLITEDRLKASQSTETSKDVLSSAPSNKSCGQAQLQSSFTASCKYQQPSKTQLDTSGPCGALQALLDELRDTVNACGPCAELRAVLNAAKYKSDESQSISDDCTKIPAKCVTKEDTTISTSTNDCDDECDCMDESAEPKAPDAKPEQKFVPACPCYCYYMALIASSQGRPMPIQVPGGLDNLASLKFPMYSGVQVAQVENKGDCQCDVEPPIAVPEPELERHAEIRDNKTTSESQQGPPREILYISNDNKSSQDAAQTESLQNLHITQNEKSEIGESPAKLGVTPLQNYESEFGKLYAEEETPRTYGMTPNKDQPTFEQPSDLALYHIERLGSVLAKDLYLRPNFQGLNELDEGEDYPVDGFGEEFNDEESELGKEKRAESRKRKEPCDCCHCRDAAKGKCMSVATPQQLDTEEGANEFKYFIDSIILDLDAMEHARRKCSVIKNVCMPKPGGACSRESFPVTITEVHDLGAASLYVKWAIHDCYGIGGYEIFVDGYLTNRYYHSRHEAAVITDVDVTIPHKIALVAQPSLRDDSLKMLCSPQKKSKSKCETKADHRKSYTTPASLWTPSIYLYDPAESKASQALPIMKYTI